MIWYFWSLKNNHLDVGLHMMKTVFKNLYGQNANTQISFQMVSIYHFRFKNPTFYSQGHTSDIQHSRRRHYSRQPYGVL